MLKRFEVTNFKNFKDTFIFNLSDTKDYQFNSECVENGIVKTGLIYGRNGCGKSNLGYALMDIQNHLNESWLYKREYSNSYLNASSKKKIAEFKYVFEFCGAELIYSYGKTDYNQLAYELITVDGEVLLELDRRITDKATYNVKGTETLNNDFSESNISILKYVLNNTIITEESNSKLSFLWNFTQYMHLMKTIHLHAVLKDDPAWISEQIIKKDGGVKEFEKFLNKSGIECQLTTNSIDGKELVAFQFDNHSIDFNKNASTGTLSLTHLYLWINLFISDLHRYSFIFIDEFDAFYHHELSKAIVMELKSANSQVIFTTHNTGLMNNDQLRPDCCFVMDNEKISPLQDRTNKELRKAHNLEKMYRAGAFNA